MRWEYCGSISNEITGELKSVVLNGQMLVYAVANGGLKVFSNAFGNNVEGWNEAVVAPTEIFNGSLTTSILSYEGMLYATSASGDGIVYESADGVNWSASAWDAFTGKHVKMLLATLDDRVAFMQEENGKSYFNSTADAGKSVDDLQEVPDDFPGQPLSFANYKTTTNQEGIMLVGETPAATADTQTTTPWGYMGGLWASFPASNDDWECPAIEGPSIVYYNNDFYVFGKEFDAAYVSQAGILWQETGKQFYFPVYDWRMGGKPSVEAPEFRGRQNYSIAYDTENQYIYFLFGKELNVMNAYDHDSEVWRARVNQLWFDLANSSN